MNEAVRTGYEEHGVDNYYKIHRSDYSNPHKEIINELLTISKKWNLGNNILDLCCGSGEVTKNFETYNIEGIDPYTYELYSKNTNRHCYNYSFKDIVQKGLPKNYDTVICSFAMHLCEESMLPSLLYRIGEKSNRLIILTPHKRPSCNGIYGWKEVNRIKIDKVSMILYEK